jgi:small subunit ribosomal protein S18
MEFDREERKGGRGAPRGAEGEAGMDDPRRRQGRRKMCRFCADPKIYIDYKEIPLLVPYVTDRGKLVPRRISGNCAKHQRAITQAVKRARNIALMPFAVAGE